ncbi:MAG: NAD(P)H-hydrate dehydratase [Synergistaceae bacterium]|jgi:NAD(P)H-hydrate epimerase|nr:NAD(P)H-hydrate dehydratase [Synergistaceae bacterium]
MRRFYPISSIKDADRVSVEDLAIPSRVLMENAGRGAADAIAGRYPDAKNFLILCGSGNNGGDGFVVARHLMIYGLSATVVSTRDIGAYNPDARSAAIAAANLGVVIISSEERSDDDISELINIADVVVDALLGVGSSGEPRGEARRLMSMIEETSRIVSLDIPSGVDPDTGEAAKNAVRAEMTVTFLAEKRCMAVTPGAFHCGDVKIAQIGVPADRVLSETDVTAGFDRLSIPSLIPSVPDDAHKGTRGGLLVIGGSANFRGAPVLAARAALRAGGGLVFLAIPDFQVEGANALLPEAIFLPLPSKDGSIRFKGSDKIIEPWYERCDAVVLGPGLGRSRECERLTAYVHREWNMPLLLDADALYHLAGLEKALYPSAYRKNMLITPHVGEASRLLGNSAKNVSKRRLASCEELVIKFGATLLKGPRTLIASESERRVILEGGPFLAVPGSGDVLSGLIGAFMAMGMPILDAATLGALVHAEAGRMCGKLNGILAREIADNIKTEVAN